jgi:hypothetical protein
MIIDNLEVKEQGDKYIVTEPETNRSFGIFTDTLETDSYWFCSVNTLEQIQQFIETEKQLIVELNKK